MLTLVISIDQNVLMWHPLYILVLCLNSVTVCDISMITSAAANSMVRISLERNNH